MKKKKKKKKKKKMHLPLQGDQTDVKHDNKISNLKTKCNFDKVIIIIIIISCIIALTLK